MGRRRERDAGGPRSATGGMAGAAECLARRACHRWACVLPEHGGLRHGGAPVPGEGEGGNDEDIGGEDRAVHAERGLRGGGGADRAEEASAGGGGRVGAVLLHDAGELPDRAAAFATGRGGQCRRLRRGVVGPRGAAGGRGTATGRSPGPAGGAAAGGAGCICGAVRKGRGDGAVVDDCGSGGVRGRDRGSERDGGAGVSDGREPHADADHGRERSVHVHGAGGEHELCDQRGDGWGERRGRSDGGRERRDGRGADGHAQGRGAGDGHGRGGARSAGRGADGVCGRRQRPHCVDNRRP